MGGEITALRKSLAAVTALGALYALLWAPLFAFSNFEEIIIHNRKIAAAFDAGSDFVERFRQTQGRVPTDTEFHEWASAQPGTYALEYWRGEWFEYYASWARASTLTFAARNYYISGSSTGDVMIAVVPLFALGTLTWKL